MIKPSKEITDRELPVIIEINPDVIEDLEIVCGYIKEDGALVVICSWDGTQIVYEFDISGLEYDPSGNPEFRVAWVDTEKYKKLDPDEPADDWTLVIKQKAKDGEDSLRHPQQLGL